MTHSLLSLTIGPVQGFIAQARRAEDLFAGSELLSRLMAAAHNRLNQPDCQILYPRRLGQQGNPESLTHKLLAQVPGDDEAVHLAGQIEQDIRAEWVRLADTAKESLNRYAPPEETIWTEQIKQLPEIYWTVTPWEGGKSYANVFEQAGRDLAARKVLRNFGSIKETGPKCTICGERAALHSPGKSAREYWGNLAEHLPTAKLRPDGKEALCAICAVKRFAKLEQRDNYPSVSYIAVAPFKKALIQQMNQLTSDSALFTRFSEHLQTLQLLKAQVSTVSLSVIPALSNVEVGWGWQDIRKEFLRYDGEWLLPETYERLTADPGSLPPNTIQQAQDAVAKLLKVAKDIESLSPHRPSPYYAILFADGDQMGKQLSETAKEGKERHIQISETLAHFAASEARQIVEQKYTGRVIYAGGDDVLALLPTVEALPAANELRKRYYDTLKSVMPEPYMSVGIAIVHHLTPLKLALAAARTAEQAAKKRFDRKAIAVSFHKRSGEELLLGAKWEFELDTDPKQMIEAVILVDDIRQRFMAQKREAYGLSSSLAHALLDEAYFLDGEGKNALPPAAKHAEIQRLLIRHAASHLSKEGKLTQAQVLAPRLVNLAEKGIPSPKQGAKDEKCKPDLNGEPSLVMLARWLLLMRFLAQKGESHE